MIIRSLDSSTSRGEFFAFPGELAIGVPWRLLCWRRRREENSRCVNDTDGRPAIELLLLVPMASFLDLLPPELQCRILTSVDSLDLYFLSLTSHGWHHHAWNFLRYLDLRSFYAACISDRKSSTHKHRKWRKQTCSLISTPSYPDVDVAKLPTTGSIIAPLSSSVLRQPTSIRGLKSSSLILDADSELFEASKSEDKAMKGQKSRKTNKNSFCRRVFPYQPRPNSYPTSNKPSSLDTFSMDAHYGRSFGGLIYSRKWKPHNSLAALLDRTPRCCIGEISLTGCYVYPKLFKILANSCAGDHLMSLNLGCVYGFTAASMLHISKLGGLQCLSLRGCEGVGSATLHMLRKMTSLTFLDIRDSLTVNLSYKDMNWRHLSTSSAVLPSNISHGYTGMERLRLKEFSVFRELPDFDESIDPAEELFEVCDLRNSGASVSSGWYTPAHEIFEAVSDLRNLVTLLVTEWNRTADFPEYGRYLAVNASLRSLALQYADPLAGWHKIHPTLESLSFASGRYANYFVASRHFENLQLPNLSVLDLTRCYRINDAAVEAIVTAAPRLRELKLGFCDAVSNLALSNSIVPKLQNSLTSLDLRHIDSIGDSGIHSLAKMSKLTRLTLAGLPHLRCCSFLTELPQLKYLDLSRCAHLYLDTIAGLADAPSLQKLSLRNCPRLTYESVRPLLERSKTLTSIDLRDCPQMTRALRGSMNISKGLRCCLVTPIEAST